MKRFLLVAVVAFCAMSLCASLPAVALKDINGQHINTADIGTTGKPVIISFFATWCKPCLRELKAIDELYADWQEETGVEMFIVSTDQGQDVQKVKPFVDGYGWEYHVLLDPDGSFKRAMNVQHIPHLFVLDRTGKIVYNHMGYVEGEEKEIPKYLK